MLRILIISFFAFFFSQCTEPPVVFTSDQPDGLAPTAYFEPVYRGIFQCESDSAIVYVKAKTIYKEKAYDFKVSRAEIDAYDGATLINGELWIEEFADPIPVTVEGDSVSGNLLLRDTIFDLSKDHVLKYFRGHQILSKKLADGKWEVLILSVDYDLDLRLSKAFYLMICRH